MKVSEITISTVKEFLGISDGEENSLAVVLSSAIVTAKNYTGLTTDEMDEYEDITIAVVGICNDYYNGNRPEKDGTGMNEMSKNILAMYSKNYL